MASVRIVQKREAVFIPCELSRIEQSSTTTNFAGSCASKPSGVFPIAAQLGSLVAAHQASASARSSFVGAREATATEAATATRCKGGK
eukprot:6174065-Pleurochrysis_carterae.AAC.2